MENIAHTLVGLRLADLGFREKLGRSAPWIAAAAANLPDIDVFVGFFDEDIGNWYHRGITHSFFGWPLIALLGAAISLRLSRRGTFGQHLSLWALSLLSHALLDWPTTWGTLLFYPLSETRFALDWIFIVDLMFWFTAGILPWWLRRRGRPRERAAAIGLFSLGAWILFSGMVREQAAAQAPEPVYAYPGPFAPLYWTGVAEEGGEVRRYFLTPWSAAPAGEFRAPAGEAVERLRRAQRGERWFWMANAPALISEEKTAGGDELILDDLAFGSWLMPDGRRFWVRFRIRPDGEVERLPVE